MINVDSVRRLLAIADAGKDPYAVAEIAGELLGMNEKDAVAAAHYARSLMALKLNGAAQRMMAGESGVGMASGVVPWASRARRFAANLAALQEGNPEAATLVRAAAADLVRYELHLAGDGNFQVLDTGAGIAVRQGWLGGLANHKATEALWKFDRTTPQMINPIALDGLGFGWLFLEALRTTENSFLNYSCPVYVVERDPLALAMLLHMHDLQEVLRSPRVRLFVGVTGEQALGLFRGALRKNATWTLPHIFIRCALRSTEPVGVEECVSKVRAERQVERDAWMSEASDYYSSKDVDYWRARFSEVDGGEEGVRPLRVLGITSRYTTVLQYSMAELQAAVSCWRGASGNRAEMKIAIEPDDQSLENPFLELIAKFKPDLIVQISRMRYENPALPENVPFLCWDQDNLPCMRDSRALASMTPLTFVAGHGAVFGAMFLKWPLQNCIFCHPAGMTHDYGRMLTTARDDSRFESDVSYISHASGSPVELRNSLASRWPINSAARVVYLTASEEVLTASAAGHRWDFWTLRQCIASHSERERAAITDAQRDEILNNLTLVTDRFFRHETLSWIARWCEARHKQLKLWGKGWESHPTLAKYSAGVAMPGEQACAVYRSTRINLQIIETGLLHSRVLDGWASGGFFLIRQSIRVEDEKATLNLYRIAKLTQSESITTIAALEGRGSDELRSLWAAVAADFREQPRDAPFPGFIIWRQLPPAEMLIPNLEKIVFKDEHSFGQKADIFLESPSARAEVQESIRGILNSRFSYDARFGDFFTHIASTLQQAPPVRKRDKIAISAVFDREYEPMKQ